jgi:hypothetical protein
MSFLATTLWTPNTNYLPCRQILVWNLFCQVPYNKLKCNDKFVPQQMMVAYRRCGFSAPFILTFDTGMCSVFSFMPQLLYLLYTFENNLRVLHILLGHLEKRKLILYLPGFEHRIIQSRRLVTIPRMLFRLQFISSVYILLIHLIF